MGWTIDGALAGATAGGVGWLEVSLLVRWLLGWALALRFPRLPPGAPRHRRRLS
ncbi:MAG: hypothetical protein RLZZ117_1835, partial [Cyanobacteriota bacterium]